MEVLDDMIDEEEGELEEDDEGQEEFKLGNSNTFFY